MAVNFAEMPVDYGLVHAFDCETYKDGDNTWQNSVDGHVDATIVGASKYVDGAIYFPPDTGFAYWYEALKNSEITYYFLGKVSTDVTTDTTHRTVFSVGIPNNNFRESLTLSCRGVYKTVSLWTGGGVQATSKSFTDYCVVAVSQFNGVVKIYYNGLLVDTYESTAYNYCNFAIAADYNTSTVPTTGKALQSPYVKCIVVANTQHSDYEITQNSSWLLTQYGLKEPPLDSKMSGADAAAIAWCVKMTLEQAASIKMQKKAYRKGLVNGGDEATEIITEPFDTDFNLIPENISIDMSKGVYIKTGEITVDGVTGVFQLRIYLGEVVVRYLSSGTCDWGLPPVVTLTGNGITKTLVLGDLETNKGCWSGSTSASAPNVQDGNEFCMTSAKINKSSATFGGKYYWEYSGGYSDRYWQLSGDFATALQAGEVVSTVPFTNI